MHLAIQKDGFGFQVFNAVNDTATANMPTRDLLGRYCPGVPIRRELGEHEAPLSNRKAREVLGFKEAHNWRKYVKSDSGARYCIAAPLFGAQMVALWSRREDAVARRHQGGRHEQARSRQSPSQP